MTLLNAKDHQNAVDRLKSWLATNPEIPRFRQRANRAAICRQASIARSTANANSEIRSLFVGLDLNVLAAQRTILMDSTDQKSTVLKVASSPPYGRSYPTSDNGDSLALKYLLQTGRVVR